VTHPENSGLMPSRKRVTPCPSMSYKICVDDYVKLPADSAEAILAGLAGNSPPHSPPHLQQTQAAFYARLASEGPPRPHAAAPPPRGAAISSQLSPRRLRRVGTLVTAW
jgi:hypothetical protein